MSRRLTIIGGWFDWSFYQIFCYRDVKQQPAKSCYEDHSVHTSPSKL